MQHSENIFLQIAQFMQDLVQDENVDKMKLSKSFVIGYYNNEKHSEIKTILNFQISDGKFLFTVNINKDKDGNIIMLNIKKDDL